MQFDKLKPHPGSSIWRIGVEKTPVVMVEPPKRRVQPPQGGQKKKTLVLGCDKTSVPFPISNLIEFTV